MSDAEDHAIRWTHALAARTIETLRPEARSTLLEIPWIAARSRPELAGAAVMARLASAYAAGDTPDRMRAMLAAAAGEQEPIDAAKARSLTVVAVLMVRSGAALPNPRWWAPHLLCDHLAVAIAREDAASGAPDAANLTERLWLPEEHVAFVRERALHPAGIDYSADGSMSAELRERITMLIPDESIERSIDDIIETRGQQAGDRLDLLLAAAQLEELHRLRVVAEAGADTEVVEAIAHELHRFADAARGLSGLELELMRAVEPDEQLLMDVADIAQRVLAQSREGIAPLPDLLDGVRELPLDLASTLGLGFHGFQQRSGPIAHWSIVLEGPEPESLAEGRVGIGIQPADPTSSALIVLVRSFVDGEAVDAQITYPLPSAETSLNLALLVLTQHVRIDFFHRDRLRAIRHLQQAAVPLANGPMPELRQYAIDAARDLMKEGADAAIARLRAELEPDPETVALSGFLINDQGKSEQLLDLLLPAAVLGPYRSATPEDAARLVELRRAMLLAEAGRIDQPSVAADELAAAAETAYVVAVQAIRGKGPHPVGGRDQHAVMEQLTQGVATERQAIAHLAITNHGLEVLWADRASGRLHAERLVIENVDLDRLHHAVSEPELGSVADLDNPASGGPALGEALARQAATRGIERVVLCPTRWLHRVPFHALSVDAGDEQRLLDVIDVIYAPSAAVLRELATIDARDGGTVVTAFGLHHAADEATIVDAVTEDTVLLVGTAATPAALLAAWAGAGRVHICSHGRYEPQDYLSSRLRLAGDEGHGGILSIARLLAEAPLRGTDLAVLGACFSGAGETEDSSLDIAGGIDSALVAAGVRNVVSALWEIDDFAALLFHAELYTQLAAGRGLTEAYAAAVTLLRSGAWRTVRQTPLGASMVAWGIDLDAAFAQLEADQHSDGDDEDVIDFATIQYWAPFRLCGLGSLNDT